MRIDFQILLGIDANDKAWIVNDTGIVDKLLESNKVLCKHFCMYEKNSRSNAVTSQATGYDYILLHADTHSHLPLVIWVRSPSCPQSDMLTFELEEMESVHPLSADWGDGLKEQEPCCDSPSLQGQQSLNSSNYDFKTTLITQCYCRLHMLFQHEPVTVNTKEDNDFFLPLWKVESSHLMVHCCQSIEVQL